MKQVLRSVVVLPFVVMAACNLVTEWGDVRLSADPQPLRAQHLGTHLRRRGAWDLYVDVRT